MTQDMMDTTDTTGTADTRVRMYYAGGGFYNSAVHTQDQIPAGAMHISDALYQDLLDGQSLGMVIAPPDRTHPLPYLTDPAPPTDAILAAARIAEIDTQLDTINAAKVLHAGVIADILSLAAVEGESGRPRPLTPEEQYTLDLQGTWLADYNADAESLQAERAALAETITQATS